MITTPRISFLVASVLLPFYPMHAQQTFAPSKIAKMDASAYLAPLPADGVVPLKMVAGDFATNETAATGKYSGQRITVIGRIAALSKGNSENKVLEVTMQDLLDYYAQLASSDEDHRCSQSMRPGRIG